MNLTFRMLQHTCSEARLAKLQLNLNAKSNTKQESINQIIKVMTKKK